MITSKPFSTISYNSAEFLEIALFDFIRSGKIYFYCFIEHQPEKDEAKAHKHLFIYPNGKVDTDQVLSKLVEIDLKNPEKPLRCLMPRPSKFDDFYLYSCHNKAYLLSKGQARTYEYNFNQFVTSDSDTFAQLVSEIDFSRITKLRLIEQAISDGRSFSDIVFSGLVPIQQINQYFNAYQLGLERNGRTTHTPNLGKGAEPLCLADENPDNDE